jgi:uracil-DNA glycosylase
MIENITDELAEIAAVLKNHLKYLNEIGVTEIEPHRKHPDLRGVKAARDLADRATYGEPCALKSAVLDTDGVPNGPEASIVATVGPDDSNVTEPAENATTAGHGSSARTNLPLAEQENMEEFDLFGQPIARPAPAGRNLTPTTTAALTLFDSLPNDASLEEIRNDIGDCTRCKLCNHRTRIVFGEGNPKAHLVFVGEGPGADEDATGRPFVGRAGKLLDKIIEAMEFKRSDVYICNVVKCRPPENRAPEPDEVDACRGFLFRQLKMIRPKVIVALGAPALHCLTGTREGITKARGQWREWNGSRLIATYHPSYLLRVPPKKRETWEDIKKVREYLATH